MRHVLVVANRTVGGNELAEVITARHAAGVHFHLLVPVPPTPPIGVAMGFSAMEVGMIPAVDGPDEREVAHERLVYGLEWMQGLGVTVTGAVGRDRRRAGGEVGARRPSDRRDHHLHAPTSLSRWLRQDLPHRVERKFKLPVTVVTAATSPTGV